MHSVVRSLTRSLTLASTLGHSFQLGGAPKFARGAAAAAAMSSSTVETTRNVKQPGSILRVISLSPEPSYTVGVQATWPFTEADLRRHDEMSDAEFYSQPRLYTILIMGALTASVMMCTGSSLNKATTFLMCALPGFRTFQIQTLLTWDW